MKLTQSLIFGCSVVGITMVPSFVFAKSGTEIAKKQGYAYSEAVEQTKKNQPHAEKFSGDYRVTAFSDKAKGWYNPAMGRNGLVWRKPSRGENEHFEVAVQDRYDYRFVPNLNIRVKVFDNKDRKIDERGMIMIWHPEMNHYGTNLHLGKEGVYKVVLYIREPQFGRHDKNEGLRYGSLRRVEMPLIVR